MAVVPLLSLWSSPSPSRLEAPPAVAPSPPAPCIRLCLRRRFEELAAGAHLPGPVPPPSRLKQGSPALFAIAAPPVRRRHPSVPKLHTGENEVKKVWLLKERFGEGYVWGMIWGGMFLVWGGMLFNCTRLGWYSFCSSIAVSTFPPRGNNSFCFRAACYKIFPLEDCENFLLPRRSFFLNLFLLLLSFLLIDDMQFVYDMGFS